MKKKLSFLVIILVVSPFYNVLLIHATTTTTPFTPVSHTIAIEITKYGIYNTSNIEIDVSKNTTYTIIFVNQYSEVFDLTILKPGIYVTNLNCTNITSQFYDLQLGPISNTTVERTWSSPNFETWIIYYDSHYSGCGGTGTLQLIKVGTPTQSPPFTSYTEPGFETGILIIAVSGLVFLRIRIRIRNKKY